MTYRVYIDESGNPKNDFYVITAIALKQEIRAEDIARKIVNTPLNSPIKSIMLRILYESGELKGRKLIEKINDYNKRNPSKTLSIYDVGLWLSEILKDSVISIRSVIIETRALHDLFVIFRDNLRNYIRNEMKDALTRKRKSAQSAYFSILATDSISRWLLEETIDRIFFKLLRIQAVHEVLPRLLLDIGTQNKDGIEPSDIMIFIDKDSKDEIGAYDTYLSALPEIMNEKVALPPSFAEALSKIYNRGIDCAYAIPSHCEKLRILGKYNIGRYRLCNKCNYEICPSGIWLADIISYIIFRCLNESSKNSSSQSYEEFCETMRDICRSLRETRERLFWLFVIPRESEGKVREKLSECMQ